MTSDDINSLEIQEFRLHAADLAGEAARIVAAFPGGIEPAVPLLTSIDDRHDVATVRALHAGEQSQDGGVERSKLEQLVESWQPVRRYVPRIAERGESPPSHYRLAVTESGINNAETPRPPTPVPRSQAGAPTRLGLLWIGSPVGTYAGLMTLVGNEDAATRLDPSDWPLPLSRPLGVRIYESRP